MWNVKPDPEQEALERDALRVQAERQLTPAAPPEAAQKRAADALGVLHRLASQSDSAVDALKLLHELQVHQVELQLQHEEIERARAELMVSRDRYAKLYAFAPVAYFSVAQDLTIREANLAAAALFATDRHRLRGRRFADFLMPASRLSFNEELAQVAQGLRPGAATLDLCVDAVPPRRVRMEAVADPAESAFLIVLGEIQAPLPNRDAPQPTPTQE